MFYRQADGQKTICELRRDETECVMERERERERDGCKM